VLKHEGARRVVILLRKITTEYGLVMVSTGIMKRKKRAVRHTLSGNFKFNC